MDANHELREFSLELTEKIPYLKFLVLFGSRARGNNNADSDWDFAVLYDEQLYKHHNNQGWDWLRIYSILARLFELPEDKIDVVDLAQCSPWLAHSIVRDGKVIFEKEPGEFEKFRQRTLKSETELKAYQQTVREKVRSAIQRWKA